MTERTPDEILDAIDKALADAERTAARLRAAKPNPRRPVHRAGPDMRPKTPDEILDAIDKALEATHRRFAATEAADGAPPETANGT